MSDPSNDSALETLRRWEQAGGLWRVVSREDDIVDIALLTCTADEEMGHLRTNDPGVLAHVRDRPSSDADEGR